MPRAATSHASSEAKDLARANKERYPFLHVQKDQSGIIFAYREAGLTTVPWMEII